MIQNAANSAVGLYLVQLARYCGYWTVNVARRENAADIFRGTGHAARTDPSHYGVSEIKDAVAAAASDGRSGKILIVPRAAEPSAQARELFSSEPKWLPFHHGRSAVIGLNDQCCGPTIEGASVPAITRTG